MPTSWIRWKAHSAFTHLYRFSLKPKTRSPVRCPTSQIRSSFLGLTHLHLISWRWEHGRYVDIMDLSIRSHCIEIFEWTKPVNDCFAWMVRTGVRLPPSPPTRQRRELPITNFQTRIAKSELRKPKIMRIHYRRRTRSKDIAPRYRANEQIRINIIHRDIDTVQ